MYFQDIELDGRLTDAHGISIAVHCWLRLPLVRHAAVAIDLSVPHACMPVPTVKSPCKFTGEMTLACERIEVELRDVWYRYLPTNRSCRSTAGLAPITLTHVGRLVVRKLGHSTMSVSRPRAEPAEVKFFITTPDLFVRNRNWCIAEPSGGESLLYTIKVPGLGDMRLVRYWACKIAPRGDSFSGMAGTYAAVTIPAFMLDEIDQHVACCKEALLILSMLCRQQIQLVGWDVADNQVWIDPLDPLIPPYIPYEPGDSLIQEPRFAYLATQALAGYSVLETSIQQAVKLMIVGLVPFVEMAVSQRYMALMHALDVLPTPEDMESADLSPCDMELIEALDHACSGRSPKVVERIDGFKKMVMRPAKNFATKMRRIPTVWGVETSDLWTVSGTDRKLGLVAIRDRLAHKGPSGQNAQSLAVATWHLSILVERLALTIMAVDLSGTRVTPQELRREQWYVRDYWLQRQAALLS